jgi:hypothetical protein
VKCFGCRKRFCFKHKDIWHETRTCDEQDRFLADPVNFRSQFDLQNEKVELEKVEEARIRQMLEDEDRSYAQELLDEEEREEARAQAEREKQERKRREEEARAEKERKKRKEREKREKEAAEANKRRQEERANLDTIAKTTKPCPSCTWPIEKNEGW